MKDFSTWMGAFQTEWKRSNVRATEEGPEGKGLHPWILPVCEWEQGLWRDLRSGGRSEIAGYLAASKIEKHAGCSNLKSSWVACANLYFPFRGAAEDRALLASFFRSVLSDEIRTVDYVELEYAEQGDLAPSAILGESGGKRGNGQTSPDIAFLVNGAAGIVLTESKLTEHSFYLCSARTRTSKPGRPGNPMPERCKDARAVVADPEAMCHQVAWGRKYWELLEQATSESTITGLKACPAAFAGYQLLRQQALAEGYTRKYDPVISAVAYDARNESLTNSLKSTGVDTFPSGWSALFHGRARFTAWTHQAWVDWVRRHHDGRWADWLAWVEARYGYDVGDA